MIHDLFRRVKPLYPEQIERLWIEYQLGDPDRQREINELLTILAIKHLGMMVGEERLLLDPPPPALIGRGDFLLGNTTYPGLSPAAVRIGRDELLRHLFILGPTGTGKSTLLIGLIAQLLAAHIPVMIFDFKRNYRCLLRQYHAVVFTVGRTIAPLRINALRPPNGVPFEEWAAALADIISTSYLLLQGARNVLVSALCDAHRSHRDRATLRDACDAIHGALGAARPGSRRYGWLESTARTLDELTKGGLGSALNDPDGTPLDALLAESVIFELHGFADDQKRCFCLLFLQGVLLARKNMSAARERLQHVLVFDEAHNVFPREKFGEPSVPARLAREVREYGEALIAATQQADVSESLIANSGFKIILRCDYPKDVTFASQLLQLEPKWLPRLTLGSAIARFPVRYYLPFHVTFPPQPIKNTIVSDTLVRQAWLESTISRTTTPRAPTERELALLADVARCPIAPITTRYGRLGWNAKTGNTIKNAAITQGLATFDAIPTPTGQVKILRLTNRARDVLAHAGVQVPHSRAGGAEHEYWKFVVAERLQNDGFTVTAEYAIGGGKTVDLYATRGEHRLIIEVETGRSEITATVAKCASQSAQIIFIFTNPQVRSAHEAMIRARLPNARLLTTADISGLRW